MTPIKLKAPLKDYFVGRHTAENRFREKDRLGKGGGKLGAFLP